MRCPQDRDNSDFQTVSLTAKTVELLQAKENRGELCLFSGLPLDPFYKSSMRFRGWWSVCFPANKRRKPLFDFKRAVKKGFDLFFPSPTLSRAGFKLKRVLRMGSCAFLQSTLDKE